MDITGLTIGLASLFSTCIECFDYYKSAQSFENDIQIILVKLDIEKTRLLIWGNAVGILQASIQEGRSATLEDSRNADLVQRCLEQMKSLLTNATELESKYGMQQIVHTSPLWEPPSNRNLISLNSMNIFRTSYRRFWVRYGNEANRPSLLAKTRWAIHDKLKFETLIVNLRELIDGLNQIVPVSKESQDRILQDDIASIPDRSRLKIIQSACEESYAGLSDVASTVAAESEIGTIDGWLRNTQMGDLEDVDSIRLENGQQAVFSLDQYLAQMYTPKRKYKSRSAAIVI